MNTPVESVTADISVGSGSCPLTNKLTVLPGSAVPVIVGVVILVNEVVVVITGASGAVVSIVIGSSADGTEVFPAASVAVTVNV